jgi:Cu2+-exporting ATPase
LGTGIRVSVPTTILSALTNADRNGVFIRSGRAIEILAKVDTVIFDKTGTLTQGHAGVTEVKITNAEISERELIALAATAEQGLNHPIAEAIVRHAREREIPLDHCDDWQYQVGLGVISMIKGMKVLVGSHLLMEQEHISLESLHQQYPDIRSGVNSLVYVAGDGQLLGVILYSDPPRWESKQVIQELRKQAISSYMLSGDMAPVAQAVAKELGIDSNYIYAEAFPERKVEVVKDIHASGRTVAFCGDGINDSAALAYADVSISFAGATDIARETADVVLMTNDLRGLLTAIKISQQAMAIIQENISIVAIPNIGALIAGIFYALDPILAIIINNGSAIVAELNGLRPLSNSSSLAVLDAQPPTPDLEKLPSD